MCTLKEGDISRVYVKDGWLYKRQPKYLTDNEWYALSTLASSGYVPEAERLEDELVRMRFIRAEPVTAKVTWMSHVPLILGTLQQAQLRHGDLSVYAIVPSNNHPYIIDWAESRMWDDPRPDKRREGDAHWLRKSMLEVRNGDWAKHKRP